MADGRTRGRYGRAGDWRLWLSRRDARAGERLRSAYGPLAEQTASRGAPSALVAARGLADDLRGACAAALARALREWDPARGVAFDTYAIETMRWAVRLVVRADDHLPRNLREREPRVAARRAAGLDTSPPRAAPLLEAASRFPASLDAPYQSRQGPVRLSDVLEAAEDTAAEALVRYEASRLRAAVASLPERERVVVVRRYWGEMSLRECGAGLGRDGSDLGHNGADYVHARALARLRRKMGG